MNSSLSSIQLTSDLLSSMERDVDARINEEACGFVLGVDNVARRVIPVTNILHDPYRFRMAPEEELRAFLLAEEYGEEFLAIYHSHPLGIDHPSATDLQEQAFHEIIYLIWYRVDNLWHCKAFLMEIGSPPVELPVILSTNMER